MQIENARIQWLDDGLPYSEQFKDVYYSRAGEQEESLHVFINAHDLHSRWRSAAGSERVFVIAELGFGCGLNFLQTWQHWLEFKQQHPDSTLTLQYLAFEKHPPALKDMERLFTRWPELANLSKQLLAQYPDHSAGCHRIQLAPELILDLYYGDAETSLQQFDRNQSPKVNVWFADGFSPAKNGSLWSKTLFSAISKCSRSAASLSTYSVAGTVRQHLQEAGFGIEKLPGFANKRHMLLAIRQASPAPEDNAAQAPQSEPWFDFSAPPVAGKEVTIIGAGLAGCALAHSLAIRGYQVNLLEAAKCTMAAASGSGQLALRCRLLAEDSSIARFYLQAFLFACRQFGKLDPDRKFWHPCGLIQLDSAMEGRSQRHGNDLHGKLMQLYSEKVVSGLSAEELSSLAGLGVTEKGLYFPLGGWLDPGGLAACYTQHENIHCQTDSQAHRLQHDGERWQVFDSKDKLLGNSPTLVLCNATGIGSFEQSKALPIEMVRGQISQITEDKTSSSLQAVVCGARTVFPASAGVHTLSATYIRNDQEDDIRAADNEENIQLARKSFVDADLLQGKLQYSRAAIRCNTPDRLPLLGPVPDLPTMARQYGRLAQDASTRFDTPGSYLPNLYINAGHGSNGLSTTPLAAEYLASLINQEYPPLDQASMHELNPVRFLIRDLKKQKNPRLD